jgi:hypothetical protein
MTNYPSTPETLVGATALANIGESWQNLGKNLAKNLTGLGKKHVTWSVLTPRVDIKKKKFFCDKRRYHVFSKFAILIPKD